MAGWYVRRGEKVIGPIDASKLKESVAAGKLLPTDQLAKDAAGPWTEAGKTKLFESPPAVVPQVEQLTVVLEQESPQSKIAPALQTGQLIAGKVAGGTVATWKALSQALAVRAQRKHEIKLAKIQAAAMADANRPPVPQPPTYHRPAAREPVSPPPQIIQTTVVKVVNKNATGGCGCSGCGTLLLLLFIGFIALMIFSPKSERSTSTNTPAASIAPPTNGDKIGAWVMAQQFVEEKLKSPSSASFGGVFDDYQDPDNVVSYLGNGKYRIAAWVDSQNSFGAQIRTHFVCELQDMGNEKWRCTSLTFDE